MHAHAHALHVDTHLDEHMRAYTYTHIHTHTPMRTYIYTPSEQSGSEKSITPVQKGRRRDERGKKEFGS